jgi:hypothetical protein
LGIYSTKPSCHEYETYIYTKIAKTTILWHKFPTFKRSLQTKALLSRISHLRLRIKNLKLRPKSISQKALFPLIIRSKNYLHPKILTKSSLSKKYPFPKSTRPRIPTKKFSSTNICPKTSYFPKALLKPAPNTVLSKQTSNTFDRIREERAATYRRENPFKKPL